MYFENRIYILPCHRHTDYFKTITTPKSKSVFSFLNPYLCFKIRICVLKTECGFYHVVNMKNFLHKPIVKIKTHIWFLKSEFVFLNPNLGFKIRISKKTHLVFIIKPNTVFQIKKPHLVFIIEKWFFEFGFQKPNTVFTKFI